MTRARDLAAFVSNADGDIKFDTDTLFIDSSANRVGISTTTPSEKLTIQSGNLNFMGGTNDAQYIKFGDTGDDDIGNILYYHGNNNMVLTTNASEAMRIDDSGNVGIGTSSPTGVPTTTLHINGTTNAGIHITDSASGATDSDGVYLSMDSPNLYIQNKEAGFTAFETSGTERMRILSGGGLTFNGDTAAANALDDYEEGEFTPTVVSGFTSTTITNSSATYTKIGRLVTFQLRLQLTAGTQQSSQFVIGGLPFTQNSTRQGSMSIGYWDASGVTSREVLALTTSNQIQFYEQGSNSSLSGTEIADSTFTLHCSGDYITSD